MAAISASGGRRAGHLPRAGDDRQLEIRSYRGRAEMRIGQADRQFHQHERGRGAVPRTRPHLQGLRRCRSGDGVR